MTKTKAKAAQTDKTNPEELIQKADEELESISTTINELATRQQRLIGYRQCLVDIKEGNATTKNTGSG
jgi:competence protein ComGF